MSLEKNTIGDNVMKKYLKLSSFLLLATLLMSARCDQADKYAAPLAEDCSVITTWDPEILLDKGSCFCIDEKITKDNFDTLLTNRVTKAFNGHPMKQFALDYLTDNKEKIISKKEYEIPYLAYCRGYSATNPLDKAKLENWAETNRVERIRAESKAKK